MNPLLDLQRRLSRSRPVQGTLIALTATHAQVATRSGVRTVARLSGDLTPYRVGQTVTLNGDTLIGRRPGAPPVYVV